MNASKRQIHEGEGGSETDSRKDATSQKETASRKQSTSIQESMGYKVAVMTYTSINELALFHLTICLPATLTALRGLKETLQVISNGFSAAG